MKPRVMVVGLMMLLAFVAVAWFLMRDSEPRPGRPAASGQRAESQIPAALVLISPPGPGEAVESPEPRWHRANDGAPDDRFPPIRSNWSDEPTYWELRAITDVPDIPSAIGDVLKSLDCTIPRFKTDTAESSVAWGEFERRGQRDIAILCVHTDQSASIYVFWAADPERRAVMPEGESTISTARLVDVQKFVDLDKSVDATMPSNVDHDGISIACCECCFTIYYRHDGAWFTLSGPD